MFKYILKLRFIEKLPNIKNQKDVNFLIYYREKNSNNLN